MTRKGTRFSAVTIAFLFISVACFAQRVTDPLQKGFENPPSAARPRVWWHWMNGNITQEGIMLDLEWMHRVGIAGYQNFDAALHTRNGRAFDYRRNVLRFVVGARTHDIGVYRPRHQWKFEGGIAFREIDNLKGNVPSQIAEAMQSADKKKK